MFVFLCICQEEFLGWRIGPLTDPLTDPLTVLLTGPLMGTLTGPLTGPLMGPLTGPLKGSLTGPLMGPLTRFTESKLAYIKFVDHTIEREYISVNLVGTFKHILFIIVLIWYKLTVKQIVE